MRSALSAIELTLMRCPIQWSRLYVAALRPATLFSARLAVVPTTWPAASFSFNSGTPTSGTALAGNTVYMGPSAGARDKGELRLRSNLTLAASGSMSIAELGQQAFDLATNDYLTIVEDHRPAAKHIRYSGGAWLIDYDIPYLITGTGNNVKANEEYGPLARLGPPAIGFLVGGACNLRYVGERSAAYTPGKSISTYAWTFPNGNTSAAQGTTASPIKQTYSSASPGGRYHALTVTEIDTLKTHVSYRPTWVFERSGANAPYDAALVKAISGGREQGGYRTQIAILNTTASLADFPDKTQIVVFAEDHWRDEAGDYYRIFDATGAFTNGETITGSVSGATGLVAANPATGYIQINGTAGEFIPGETITGGTGGQTAELQCAGVGGNYPYRENIALNGYVIGETVRQNPATGQVELEVVTLDEQLRRCEGYPVALTNRSTTPVDLWEESKLTTLNTTTHHFVKWRSTISEIADVEFAGTPVSDDVIVKYVTFDKMSLFEQINSFWNNTLFGWVACDFQGALYCEMDANIDETYRGSVVSGHTLTRLTDLMEEWEMPRVPIPVTSQRILLGVGYRKPMGSKRPGDPHLYEGMTQETSAGIAGPLVSGDISQLDTTRFNQWCGNFFAKENNVYRNMLYRFAGNWRMDVIPQSWITHNIVSGDTKRALTLTNKRFLPKELRLIYQERSMSLLSEIVADGETNGIAGVTYTLPTPQDPPVPTTPPVEPPVVEPDVESAASELWFLIADATFQSKVIWSGDIQPLNGVHQPTWNALATPSGYRVSATSPIANQMQMTLDGSQLYVSGKDNNNGDRETIWQLTNLAAVRAAPATAPTWSVIAYMGQTVSIGTLENSTGNGFGQLIKAIDKLYAIFAITGSANRYYSVYDGAAWSYTLADGFEADHAVSKACYVFFSLAGDFNHLAIPGVGISSNWVSKSSGTFPPEIWRRYDVNASHWVWHDRNSANPVIRHTESGGEFVLPASNSVVRFGGAWKANQIWAMLNDGKLYYTGAADANFTLFDTLTSDAANGGRVMDTKLAGNGPLILAVLSPSSSNAPILCNPTRVAGAWAPLTGNFWSIWSSASSMTIHAFSLVFR